MSKKLKINPDLAAALCSAEKEDIGILTVYIPVDDIKDLKQLALDRGASVSALMRPLIKEYLDKEISGETND